MVVDPEQLEDFVPIKRRYNKRSFRAQLITYFVISAPFFGIPAGGVSGWVLQQGS